MKDSISDDSYFKLLLKTYVIQCNGDTESIKDLIKSDMEVYEMYEMYEACAKLKKILETLE
tara:strand:+ start:1907 stop:2089 length:183 start_codon:yes stop_codon:yes gene_type:complete